MDKGVKIMTTKEPLREDRSAMKIQILHDDKGNILSFAIVKDGVSDGLGLIPKKNQAIKVVDMPRIEGGKLGDEKDFKGLFEMFRKQKVDIKSKEGKLIPR